MGKKGHPGGSGVEEDRGQGRPAQAHRQLVGPVEQGNPHQAKEEQDGKVLRGYPHPAQEKGVGGKKKTQAIPARKKATVSGVSPSPKAKRLTGPKRPHREAARKR